MLENITQAWRLSVSSLKYLDFKLDLILKRPFFKHPSSYVCSSILSSSILSSSILSLGILSFSILKNSILLSILSILKQPKINAKAQAQGTSLSFQHYTLEGIEKWPFLWWWWSTPWKLSLLLIMTPFRFTQRIGIGGGVMFNPFLFPSFPVVVVL